MIIIDGHVHIYDCFNLDRLLDCAYSNFCKIAGKLQKGRDFEGILFLAEKSGQDVFEKLKEKSIHEGGPFSSGGWIVQQTREPYLLKLLSSDEKLLYLVQGRQFVTKEGLEVLSLATRDDGNEGLPLDDQVNKSVDSGGITVIPWAFGKWFGNRGNIVRHFLEDCRDLPFFLGDNGGRCRWLPSSILIQYGKKKDSVLLSGSDPLPIPGDEQRVGSYGIYADLAFEERLMRQWLLDALCHQPERFHCYGSPLTLHRFLGMQYLLRRKKRC